MRGSQSRKASLTAGLFLWERVAAVSICGMNSYANAKHFTAENKCQRRFPIPSSRIIEVYKFPCFAHQVSIHCDISPALAAFAVSPLSDLRA